MKKIGPNLRRLIVLKMAKKAIPSGGGLKEGANFLLDPKKISIGFQEALAWSKEAISILKKAEGSNPFREMDDEQIAEHLLKKIEEKRKEKQLYESYI